MYWLPEDLTLDVVVEIRQAADHCIRYRNGLFSCQKIIGVIQVILQDQKSVGHEQKSVGQVGGQIRCSRYDSLGIREIKNGDQTCV